MLTQEAERGQYRSLLFILWLARGKSLIGLMKSPTYANRLRT